MENKEELANSLVDEIFSKFQKGLERLVDKLLVEPISFEQLTDEIGKKWDAYIIDTENKTDRKFQGGKCYFCITDKGLEIKVELYFYEEKIIHGIKLNRKNLCL